MYSGVEKKRSEIGTAMNLTILSDEVNNRTRARDERRGGKCSSLYLLPNEVVVLTPVKHI